MSLLTLKTPLRIMPAMPQRPPQANIPQTLAEREQLRDIVVRHVEERRHTLVPPLVDMTHDDGAQVLAFGERLRDVRLRRPLRHRRHDPERLVENGQAHKQ